MRLNERHTVTPSLPTKSGTALSITMLNMLMLTVIHANSHICRLQHNNHTQISHAVSRKHEYIILRRLMAVLAHIIMHTNRIFQHSLVSLTGSDVAILTAEMICPFSASASHSSHTRTEAAKATST